MIGSRQQSMGLTLSINQPLVLGGEHLFDLRDSVDRFGQTLQAFGGFERASFSLAEHDAVMFDWFENGLGRHIVARDERLETTWEGFVNEISISQGGLQLTRGPLTGITNRVQAAYSAIDATTDPPTLGIRKKTSTVEDANSQAFYGIWPVVLSLAGVTDDNADVLRDTRLAEYAYPETTSSFSRSGGVASLRIEALGYMSALGYPYNYTAAGGTVALSTQLQRVIQADPNGWISTDFGNVASNSMAVSQWQNDDALAKSLIKGLTAMGDAAATRYLFGIYDDRKAYYGPMPTDWAYEMRLSDPRRVIRNKAGGEVQPWAIRPGQWIFFSDFLSGRIDEASTDLRHDPRMVFIETVGFDMPDVLLINGGKVGTLAQKLAQFGLSGSA